MSARKALILALLASAAARADGSATTLFDSKPYFRDGGQQDNSFYEAFALNARAEGTNWLQDVRVVARGWGRVTAGPPLDEQHTPGDPAPLFLQGGRFPRPPPPPLGRPPPPRRAGPPPHADRAGPDRPVPPA